MTDKKTQGKKPDMADWDNPKVETEFEAKSLKDLESKQGKEKRCVFCKWEELYDERDRYDWQYVCKGCAIKCGFDEHQRFAINNRRIK